MEEKIIELLKQNVDELGNIEITREMQLITTGFIESFDIIQLLTVLEETFAVDLPLDDLNLEDFNTVASIAEIVRKTRGC